MFPSKPSKYHFQTRLIERLEGERSSGKEFRVLEIGSGTSEVAHALLTRFPFLRYVGIEPDPVSVAKARERLKGIDRATVIHGFGYGGEKRPELERPFDMVFSLSVLEHVKDLPTFIDYSVKMARPGADVIHLYDLGHALYPSGLKERIQTKLCGTGLLRIFPEHKVARYLATEDVRKLLEGSCDIKEVTFHNMPSLVALSKRVVDEGLMREIVAFESAHAGKVADMKLREKLFPSVCFWTKKKNA